MSEWPSTKAKVVYRAFLKIGWAPKPCQKKGSSHTQLVRAGWHEFTWAWHDNVELGPVMLKKIAKHTGLRPEDL